MMDGMFLANAMIFMDAQRQQMWQQQMDMNYDTQRNAIFPNYPPVYNHGYQTREKSYEDNTFGEVYHEEEFDTIEVYDPIQEENVCFIKVEKQNESSICILVEIKEAFKDMERAKRCMKELIYKALRQGYQNISASIGKHDEVGKEMLLEMGFQGKSKEDE